MDKSIQTYGVLPIGPALVASHLCVTPLMASVYFVGMTACVCAAVALVHRWQNKSLISPDGRSAARAS